MLVTDVLLGRPLATSEERAEQIDTAAGIPIFGLDALSSAAYGPEAALTLLIPLGSAGVSYIVPVSLAIITLLTIVFFSYRQTIAAYPGGGGSFTVATENLVTHPGLLAAAAGTLGAWCLLTALGSWASLQSIIHAGLSPMAVLCGASITVAAGIAGSFYPAFRGASISPTEALRHE